MPTSKCSPNDYMMICVLFILFQPHMILRIIYAQYPLIGSTNIVGLQAFSCEVDRQADADLYASVQGVHQACAFTRLAMPDRFS